MNRSIVIELVIRPVYGSGQNKVDWFSLADIGGKLPLIMVESNGI